MDERDGSTLSADATRKLASALGVATRFRDASGSVVWLPTPILRGRVLAARDSGTVPSEWRDTSTAAPSESEIAALRLLSEPEWLKHRNGGHGKRRDERESRGESESEGDGESEEGSDGDGEGEDRAESENGEAGAAGEGDQGEERESKRRKRESKRVTHERAPEIAAMLQRGYHVMLVGPAGSGKSTAAVHAAQSMQLQCVVVSLSGGATEAQLLGSVRPSDGEAGVWRYQSTPLSDAIEADDTLIVLDEIDASDPNTLVGLHSLLDARSESVYIPARGRTVRKGRNQHIIACANTTGDGTGDYAGRNALDLATLDRFAGCILRVDYSVKIERSILLNAGLDADTAKRVLAHTASVRKGMATAKVRRVWSTRLVRVIGEMLAVNQCACDVIVRHGATWTESERARISASNVSFEAKSIHATVCGAPVAEGSK